MKVERFLTGILSTNCYVAWNEQTKEAVIVDPAAYSKKLAEFLREEGLKPQAVLLTHGHFDHIMGLDALLEEYPVPVYVHEAEKGLIADPKTNLSLTYTNGYVFEDATYVTEYYLHLDIHRADVVITRRQRTCCSVGIHCFGVPSEGVICRRGMRRH